MTERDFFFTKFGKSFQLYFGIIHSRFWNQTTTTKVANARIPSSAIPSVSPRQPLLNLLALPHSPLLVPLENRRQLRALRARVRCFPVPVRRQRPVPPELHGHEHRQLLRDAQGEHRRVRGLILLQQRGVGLDRARRAQRARHRQLRRRALHPHRKGFGFSTFLFSMLLVKNFPYFPFPASSPPSPEDPPHSCIHAAHARVHNTIQTNPVSSLTSPPPPNLHTPRASPRPAAV